MNENITEKELYDFLVEIDKDFPVALSDKVDLHALSAKLYKKADIVVERRADCIAGVMAGYATNATTNIAYASILGVKKEYRGKKIGEKLMRTFLDIACNKGCMGVELYTTKNNNAAIHSYRKIGFVDYLIENETRPQDVHLIYRFEEEI